MKKPTAYQQLEERFSAITALRQQRNLLEFDVMTGHADPAPLATLSAHLHEELTQPEIGGHLRCSWKNYLNLNIWQRANLKIMAHWHNSAIALPATFCAERDQATQESFAGWVQARAANNFARALPGLQALVELKRAEARLLSHTLKLEPYDALISQHEPRLTSRQYDRLFTALDTQLPWLTDRIKTRQTNKIPLTPQVTATPAQQGEIARRIAGYMQLDPARLELRAGPHAACYGALRMVRISYPAAATDPLKPVLDMVHESGHALYRQHLPQSWHHQPVGQISGTLMDEAVALACENQIGRSATFARWLSPHLTDVYGDDPAFSPANLHQTFNQMGSHLLRVAADEVSYPQHILLRYQLEKDLISGQLAVADLPHAFNHAMTRRLNLSPAHDNEGCLQDPHWFGGYFGYFPGYLGGQLAAAQFGLTAQRPQHRAHGEVDIEQLTSWMDRRLWRYGAQTPTANRIASATGQPLTTQAFTKRLTRNYLAPITRKFV